MGVCENVDIQWVTEADMPEWDAFVVEHETATPYHQYAWLKAVSNAYGHDIKGVIARHSDSASVVGVLPAIAMPVFTGGKQLCALPYCDVGFAIAASPHISQAMEAYLASELKRTSYRFLEMRTVSSADNDETLPNNDALCGRKVRMLLPLPDSSKALMASFKSKLRSQIRKAEKNGLTVTLGNESSFIEPFYRVYTQNMRDLGSPVHARKWFENIRQAYANNMLISIVYQQDTPVGAGLILLNGESACIPWASTLREYNRLAPNMLLYWSLLAHCADNGIRQFDFGRSTFNEGTYRFKKQWGALPQPLHWTRLDQQGQLTELNTSQDTTPGKLTGWLIQVWGRLPLSITIKIGAFVRPYISL